MSHAPSTLPPGWANVLDEMHQRLDHAIAAANERLSHAPEALTDVAVARSEEIAKWCERLHRLSAHLEATEQIVQSADDVLQKEETALRQQLAKSTTVRQKLAATTARAIG
jgi:predicted  nucleic acid-binding Zn-ribbon protein